MSGQLVPIDTHFSEQKNILNNIQIENAWDITTGSKSIIVAVIDDGIDINHPDLRDNMIAGRDFVDGDNDPSPGSCLDPISQTELPETHGTQVAGIIGAVGNNSLGISGISWQVQIMPLRIGCFYRADLELNAVKYAIEHGATIINMSYGGPDAIARNQAVIDEIKRAEQNVLFVTAAGNYHISNDDTQVYPASLTFANVLSVAASDADNSLTEWTQYGASSVDMAAPGVDLQTTIPGDNILGDYTKVNGTSFSTAVVSGVAVLLKAYDFNNNLRPQDIKAALQASVTKINAHNGLTKTSGIINARSALDLLNLPRPVVTINNIQYDDSSAIFSNSELDPNESGNIRVTLQNLWTDLSDGSVLVSTNSSIAQLNATNFNLSPINAGEEQELFIPITMSDYSGHHQLQFRLEINAFYNNNNVSYTRFFTIDTGLLVNNALNEMRIQQNNQDDYQYYHLNIPAGMERVAVELEYPITDSRDMGILADFERRPQIHYRNYKGAPYWHKARYRSDNKTGFERISARVDARNPSTLKVMVFNEAPTNPSASYQSNKPYKLRGCFYSEMDGNTAPFVNAGTDRTVLAGEEVLLTGIASDSDGEITRSFWTSDNNIRFSVVDDNSIQFIAPSSGEISFSFEAIDDGCKRSVDRVTISIKEISGNEPDGLILNPRTLNIDENSSFNVRVSGFFNSQEVSQLSMLSAPDGVEYQKGNLSWDNAAPVGDHFVKFSANVGNQVYSGTIIITVKERGVGNGGGGCVISKNNGFDPLFLIFLLVSGVFIKKRSRKTDF